MGFLFDLMRKVFEWAMYLALIGGLTEHHGVHNHLGTVHAIALCNLAELSMAMTTEATIPAHLRFIPVGMTVSYKKKAKGTLTAVSEARAADFKVGTIDIPVHVYNEARENVMSAVITLDLKRRLKSPRPAKHVTRA